MFMAFLRQLSHHLGEDPLGEEAVAVMLRGIAIIVLTPFVGLVSLLFVGLLGPIAGRILFFAIILGCGYGLFLFLRRQLYLIGSIRQVIVSRF